MLAGALPQTPLGELTAFPTSLAGFKGEGRTRERREEGKGGKRGREKLGYSVLVIGDRHPWLSLSIIGSPWDTKCFDITT